MRTFGCLREPVCEDTLAQIKDAAEKCGFRVIAAVSAVAKKSMISSEAAN